jgi:chromosome segregation ATPase
MLQRRPEHEEESSGSTGELAAMESARSAAESGAKAEPKKKDEEHLSVFWRVFGGTILSIAALVAITIYNNMSSSITELRNEVSREREARAEMVKKEEFNTRNTAMYDRIRGIDAVKVELEGMKEKVSANAAATAGAKKETTVAVEGIKKDVTAAVDAVKKDEAALDVLKERVAGLEGVKKDIAGLDTLKEKLATTAADLKTTRDELAKVSGDVERNKTSDLERKAFRDAQAKQIEETLKEVQKGLQDCREKLARLEGAKPAPADPKPMAKSDEK